MNDTQIVKAFNECMSLQNTFNCIVNPEWKKAGYSFRRAMWIESGELCDHLGYKWWKDVGAEPDRKQLLLEVVDIFHFLMSEVMIDGRTGQDLFTSYRWALSHTYANTKEKQLKQVEEFVMCCLDPTNVMAPFFQVMVALNIDVADLLKYYLGKNALNKFRQDHGYKAGTYIKTWPLNAQNVEDNVVLEHILETHESLTYTEIYQKLGEHYPTSNESIL